MVLLTESEPPEQRRPIRLTSGVVLTGSRSVPSMLTRHAIGPPAGQNPLALRRSAQSLRTEKINESKATPSDLQQASEEIVCACWSSESPSNCPHTWCGP